MPTLLELFKSQQLPSQGGKTAEEAYDIQNSKDIRISTSDPLVNNTGFAASNLLRRTLGVRGSESLLEEEVVGVRIIRGFSIPVLYGADLPRITLRTTPVLDTIKAGANGTEGDGGLIGGAIEDARNYITDKLGIPSNIIPTRVVGDDRIKLKGITQNRMIDLADIRKSGEGTILGQFLKNSVGSGNLKTIGKQLLGGAINEAKDKIRGKLFGNRSTTGFNNASSNQDGSDISVNYGSLDSDVGVSIKTNSDTGITDVGGLMYSKTFNLTITDNEPGVLNFVDGDELEGGLASKTKNVVTSKFKLPSYDGLKAGDTFPLYSELFNNVKRNDVGNSIDGDGNIIKQTDKLTFPTKSEAVNEGEVDSVQIGGESIPYEPNTTSYSDSFSNVKRNDVRDSIDADGNIIEKTDKLTFPKKSEASNEGEADSVQIGEDDSIPYEPNTTSYSSKNESLTTKPNPTTEEVSTDTTSEALTFKTPSETTSEGEGTFDVETLPKTEPSTEKHSTTANESDKAPNDINDEVNSDGTLADTVPLTWLDFKPQNPDGTPYEKIEFTIDRNRITPDLDRYPKRLDSKRGIETKSDSINKTSIQSGGGTDANDALDFAPLKFYSIANDKTVQFRASISGLSETLSPAWDSAKFMGAPFQYYTYGGVERSITFNFKVFALNVAEHKAGWDKLNFLTGLVYPQGYDGNSTAITAPFIKFTLGDLYKNKESYIESLSYTFDDGTPWDIDEANYRLPTITDVAVTIKFLQSRSSTEGGKFYSFAPTT